MSEALIERDDSRLAISFTAGANALREAALEQSALIARVSDASQQESAVAAQIELTRVLKLVEDARKAAKEPVLEFGRKIDDAAKAFIMELKPEQMRISMLVADFQQLEAARVLAAKNAENERLAAVERERLAALSKAGSHEDLDAINQKFNDRVQQEAPPVATAARAAGQTVRDDWEFEVTDIAKLTTCHFNLVKIEPKRNEIKALLKAGSTIQGIKAWRVTKATVRVGRTPQAIEA